MSEVALYQGSSKLRINTAPGPYGRSMRRSMGPSLGRYVYLISSDSCSARERLLGSLEGAGASRILVKHMCINDRNQHPRIPIQGHLATRWTASISSKVNLSDEVNLKAVSGRYLVV